MREMRVADAHPRRVTIPAHGGALHTAGTADHGRGGEACAAAIKAASAPRNRAAGRGTGIFLPAEDAIRNRGRNYRSRRRPSEIDLVGWDGDTLCFIEVKTRTTREVKPAEAAVDLEKQRDLRAMAREYLLRHPSKPKSGFHPNEAKPASLGAPGLSGTPGRVAGNPASRFDILSIYLLDGSEPEFTLFKNAFPVS